MNDGTSMKGRYGRRGLPLCVVEAMAADYRRLGSLEKVAPLYRRSRQAVWEILHRRGYTIPRKLGTEEVQRNGVKYKPKGGYYTATTGSRAALHRVIYSEAHGPIPAGHEVIFIDGNARNFALDNLACMTVADASRLHATGENQLTAWRIEREATFDAWYALAMDSMDPVATQKAREAFEAVEARRPRTPMSGEVAAQLHRATWARYTPEEKAARLQRTIHRRWAQRGERSVVA